MQYRNSVSFCVRGREALFSDPIMRIGGEKCSYPVPTYQALKGITESIYWKPTLIWVVDRVRIMMPIRSHSKGMKPIKYQTAGNELATYTYLTDVEYQVQAHFVWNETRENLAADRNEHKHFTIAKRRIEQGGARDIFLGARECQGYVEPCKFGSGQGAYDDAGEYPLGIMFHGFTYPDESGDGTLKTRFWRPKMENGVIEFIQPDQCSIVRTVKKQKAQQFVLGEDVSAAEEDGGAA